MNFLKNYFFKSFEKNLLKTYKNIETKKSYSFCDALNKKSNNVIFETNENGLFKVQLNNIAKRNAFNLGMYKSIAEALKIASNDDKIKCVVFQGSKGIYSSGNDLSYLKNIPKENLQDYIIETIEAMDEYINELIDLKKPLIAVVDGPAIGIGCSSLGLFDLIIGSNNAEFWVPFSKIALVPEGCSSYTFPLILGLTRANNMLLFNHKMNAKQAYDWGFINKLIDNDKDFNKEVQEFGDYITLNCNIDSIIEGKKLIRNEKIKIELKKVNKTEGELMKKFWQQPAYQKYLESFYKKK